ncbi:hypothetical protein BP5796_03098 [Coleophoma crateriformis]|uniref:Uncharacterized protein n=1 Tax=Coleophoma crateriformis TaxID=565419 RepID=A0A3D8SMJ4_9HELO|nr:hypothetical protein BP5796_03098 [Coleophoma crateriformis]
MGIQLPGMFTHPRVENEAEIFKFVDSLTPRVLEEVAATLTDHIERCITAATTEHGQAYMQPALALWPATTLLQCVGYIRRRVAEGKAAAKLAFIPELAGPRPGATQGPESESPYLLDTCTKTALSLLQTWHTLSFTLQPLPALTSEDLEIVQNRSRPTTAREGDPTAQLDEDDDALLPETCGGDSGEACTAPTTDWRSPTAGPLRGFPPARFGSATWEPDPRLLELAHQEAEGDDLRCFVDSRSLPKPSLNPPATILTEITRYVQDLTEAQTPEEKDAFQKISYLNAIPEKDYQYYKRMLVLVLAAVEGGSTEALLWVIVLEGLMKDLSEYVKGCTSKRQAAEHGGETACDEVLRELVLFAHVVALNSITLRSHAKRDRKSGLGVPIPNAIACSRILAKSAQKPGVLSLSVLSTQDEGAQRRGPLSPRTAL